MSAGGRLVPRHFATHWTLDPAVSFLNHGSFGATPRAVLEEQQSLRDRMERQPVRFLVRELEPLVDEARTALALFVGADPGAIAFLPNATAGVNAVLRSLELEPGDELVTTDQEYNACRNVLEYAAARAGAKVVVVQIPFPIAAAERVVERLEEAITRRTRLVLVDHVSSQTALVFPMEQIVSALQARGVDVLVDGAHAPGMLPLALDRLGAAYYTGNLHKWVCAPKGAAFLHTRGDRRARVRPAAISHGANAQRSDRSRYHLEFDWTGTFDPTPWLCVPRALEVVGSLLPGGWPEVMEANRQLALEAREILCETLSIAPPAPAEMAGSMAAVPLPGAATPPATLPSLYGDPLQDALLDRFAIEVPVIHWPEPGSRLLRISAQLYNERSEYERLAGALEELLREGL
jgi:isopenicillin-N epimerase